MGPSWKSARVGVACLMVVASAGCSTGTGLEPGGFSEWADHLVVTYGEGVLLLTQNVMQEVTMDALFEGTVHPDEKGCLRLDVKSDYGVTAVWPQGYEVRSIDGDLTAVDADGAPAGVVGGSFSLGGGEVEELSAALGFTDADRELAHSSCPGRYWIVSGTR